MSYFRLFTKAVAEIILQGDWQQQAIADRIYWLLDSKPVWVIPLVVRILDKFYHEYPVVSAQQIAKFISDDSLFLYVWSQHRNQLKLKQYNLKLLPERPAKFNCEAFPLKTLKNVAEWLNLNFGQLENYSSHWRISNEPIETNLRHYHYHWVKKSYGQRLIEAPKLRMADAQRKIYNEILTQIPLHESCHGFRKKHSCLSYVKPHAGKAVVIRMDLESFFTSVHYRRIHALFTTIGYSKSIASCLAGLCCIQTPIDVVNENTKLTWHQRKQLMTPHLPQGSPTSPALANLSAYRLDLRLAALAKKLNAVYTRYADDLAFSGGLDFARVAHKLPVLVAHIAICEGFSINHRKTRIMRQGVSQRLTGMTLNSFPNYSRKDFDQLKAILYNCMNRGVDGQNIQRHPNFKTHLLGRINYVRFLNPEKATKLIRLYQQINWPDSLS